MNQHRLSKEKKAKIFKVCSWVLIPAGAIFMVAGGPSHDYSFMWTGVAILSLGFVFWDKGHQSLSERESHQRLDGVNAPYPISKLRGQEQECT